jgi:hypothetical protein
MRLVELARSKSIPDFIFSSPFFLKTLKIFGSRDLRPPLATSSLRAY